jgi:hypothetical protein
MPSAEPISHDEAKHLIRLATVGTSSIDIGSTMADWPADKQTAGWRILASFFRAAAEIDPQAETGKALARYEFFLQQAVKIQDWKTGLAAQREIDRIVAKL